MKERRPCAIDDQTRPDIMVMTFGEIETKLEQARFNSKTDTIHCTNGTIIENYYKDHLGIKFFSPLDKSVFNTAPYGWCSWYYYGRDITPEEILVNALWFAENMQEYGADLILLDDGWQDNGRDWDGLRETFPQGMQWLADEIKKLELTPGIWLCPQGQDNMELIEEEGCFMRNEDGSSVCATFCGPYTVDPTKPETSGYLERLIKRIVEQWGYKYLKLDGQPSLVKAYHDHHKYMQDSSIAPTDAYRMTLEAIRKGAGKKTFISGCAGMPVETVGIYNAQRTGADCDAEWENGFINAVTATMNGYFLHNIGWYSDPDCCLLRPPLSMDMARAWATLLGITGQMLLFSDRMPDLGPERVNLMKKIMPVADIQPFDLFPSQRHKNIFNLKINHSERIYDLVAVFNYSEYVGQNEYILFSDLGLDEEKRYHVYDFWSSDYLGLCSKGIFVENAPASCRLLTICLENDFPVLLSTNRHVLQGWPDLQSLSIQPETNTIQGKSTLIKNENYQLTFAMPNDGKETYRLKDFNVNNGCSVKILHGRGSVSVSWTPNHSETYTWKAVFEKTAMLQPTSIGSLAYMVGARDIAPWTIEINWISFGSPSSFYILQNGSLIGHAFGNRLRVSNLEYLSEQHFEIGIADLDGRKNIKLGSVTTRVGETLPGQFFLSDLTWQSAQTDYLRVGNNNTVSGVPLSCSGKRYSKGIGTCADSKVVYDLKGLFTSITGAVGIEDQNGIPDNVKPEESGQAVFRIVGDGREILAPIHKVYGQTPTPFNVDIAGIKELVLIVEKVNADYEIKAPHADWLGVKMTLKPIL